MRRVKHGGMSRKGKVRETRAFRLWQAMAAPCPRQPSSPSADIGPAKPAAAPKEVLGKPLGKLKGGSRGGGSRTQKIQSTAKDRRPFCNSLQKQLSSRRGGLRSAAPPALEPGPPKLSKKKIEMANPKILLCHSPPQKARPADKAMTSRTLARWPKARSKSPAQTEAKAHDGKRNNSSDHLSVSAVHVPWHTKSAHIHLGPWRSRDLSNPASAPTSTRGSSERVFEGPQAKPDVVTSPGNAPYQP